MLPPLDPLISPSEGKRHPYDTLGMYYNLPIYGGALKGLSKGTKKVLDAVSKGGEFTPSRRKFIKGSAAVAGATALGVKGLGGFGKEVAKVGEEVKSAAKIADNIPKHKFNSLKEYNDYLNKDADEAYNNLTSSERNWIKDPDNWKANWKKEFAQTEESNYKTSKFFYKDNPELKDPFSGNKLSPEFLKNIDNTLEDFSPKAKQEMRDIKEGVAEWNYFNKDNVHFSDALDNPEQWFPDSLR
jgi:hypothetical protein